MTGRFLTTAVLAGLFFLPAARAVEPDSIHQSLVQIGLTAQTPNYKVPWNPGSVLQASGSGFVIKGNQILTNAHVVSNARFLTITREGDPKRYVAAVKFIAHDSDLAILQLADPTFFEGTVPIELGDIPKIESTVSVYGYPIGGERPSVTQGVVSRIDFQNYSHTGLDAHLIIQIDAAINPGNSGGPVLQDGKLVGVAFQGFSGDVAQNVGYMIPVPVVQRFLKDIEDGQYDRYMDIAIVTFPLQNPAQRRALGLKDDDRGIMVSSVSSAGPADGILKEGDVLMSIDGLPIASDGFVEIEGQRLQMAEVVERLFKGDVVTFDILRENKPQTVKVTLNAAWPYLMQSNLYGIEPRYVVFGGLVFQPLSRDFLEANPTDDLRVRYFYDFYIADELYEEHPEVVVLSSILADPINTYLEFAQFGIVDKVNGVKIRTLEQFSQEVSKDAEDYVIELIGNARPIVLEKAAVEGARERIKTRYNITHEQNLKETP